MRQDRYATAWRPRSKAYSAGVSRVLNHKTVMLAVYAVLIGLTAFMFMRVPGGFVPAQDKQYLVGFAQLPTAPRSIAPTR